MKKSTTSVILVQAMASATTGFQKRVRPGAICHSPRSIYEAQTVSRRGHQQRQQDRQIDDRADDVVFLVVLCFLLEWSAVFAHCVSPLNSRLIRYSSGNRKIQMISTKCQYRPKFST